MDKYYVFRHLIDFVADNYDVTDADLNNYIGDIAITGTADDGSIITINVSMKGAKKDGN